MPPFQTNLLGLPVTSVLECCMFLCAEHGMKLNSWQPAELAQQHGVRPGFGMPHCESLPGSLLEQELRALRKLSAPPGSASGADLLAGYSNSLEEMYPGINHTTRDGDYIQRYLQLLCAQEGHNGQSGPVTP